MTRMETFADLEREFARVEFRMPGVTVSLEPPGGDSFVMGYVVVRHLTEDARHPGTSITVTSVEVMAPGTPARFLHDSIRSQLHRHLSHEVDEWLKRDGQLLHDPHAAERR